MPVWPAAGWLRPSSLTARHALTWPTEIPLRARFSAVADDEHVVAAVHHIAADGWSVTPLVADLGRHMPAGARARRPAGPLPMQYADYTLWQRPSSGTSTTTDSPIAAQLAYWEQRWPGCPSGCSCPPIGRIRRWLTIAAPVWWSSGRQSCSSRSPAWLASTTRPASWWSRPPCRYCCRKSAASPDVAVGFAIAGRRDPGARRAGRVSSSTPWCCGSMWLGIPPSPSCWLRCEAAAWPPTNTRTCPSRCWWSGSTRPEL